MKLTKHAGGIAFEKLISFIIAGILLAILIFIFLDMQVDVNVWS